MKSKVLTRRERRKIEQRREMLSAALELFSKKGYHNVSMHEIAEKAEFAIGTLYKFFQNKEYLYKALVLERCDEYEGVILRAIGESDDEVDKLRNFIRTKSEIFGDNLPFIRLFLAESKGASFNIRASLDSDLQKRYQRFLEILAGIFKDGIEKNRFNKTSDPLHLAVALDSVVDAFLLLWLTSPDRHPFPEDPDTILNIFFDNLIAP